MTGKNSDRISELPDAILVRILSLLEMRDAVKTGVLSKRWTKIWTNVDSLCFQYPVLREEGRIQEFVSFVNSSITQIKRPKIKTFKVSGFDREFVNNKDAVHQLLDKWIQWAVEKNVEFVDLSFMGLEYTANERFFYGSSFAQLEIWYWKLVFSNVQRVTWTSLKRLSLFSLSVDDEGIEKILSGSPSLETLIIISVVGFRHLNIMSCSVRKMHLWLDHKTDPHLKINAPHLREIVFSGNLYAFDFWGKINMPSLLKAEIGVRSCPLSDEEENYDLPVDTSYKLIEGVCHANELILGSLPVQALTMIKLSARPSPLFKCKHLNLYLPVLKYEIPGIVCLLERSPHLETLVLEVIATKEADFHGCVDEICEFDVEEYLTEHLRNLRHLKNLTAYCRHGRPNGDILSFSTSCFDFFDESENWDREFFFELLACIQKNAAVLEKLVVVAEKYSDIRCDANCVMHYVNILCQRLFGLFLEEKEADEWEFRKRKLNSKFSQFEFIFHNQSVL